MLMGGVRVILIPLYYLLSLEHRRLDCRTLTQPQSQRTIYPFSTNNYCTCSIKIASLNVGLLFYPLPFKCTYYVPVLPTLLDDIQDRMEGWGKEGLIDPFTDIYNVGHSTVQINFLHR